MAVSTSVRNYMIVTLAYWGFTITDGALRMLVLLYFNQIGYTPLQIAFLFLFYEIFGIVTNFLGGWIGSRLGLNVTLYAGIGLQVISLIMLTPLTQEWPLWFAVPYVMAAQAMSGVAKDLTKMSSKSAIRLVVPQEAESRLFKWVAILTGSKNALKGVGFFVGSVLLTLAGYRASLWIMAIALILILFSGLLLPRGMGQIKKKIKFRQLFSKSKEINILSAARFFLFGARDVWFVVGLPVYLQSVLNWSFYEVGGLSRPVGHWLWGCPVLGTPAVEIPQSRSPSPSRHYSVLDVYTDDCASSHCLGLDEPLESQCRHYWRLAPFWLDFCHEFGSPLLLGAGLHR
ncbi:organoarsenical effux MFS transporter ArsJ [Thermosynechococcus sp. B1]|nr:organoarsenical effux MFS transporter ArsJ [Thermosynechococcus sp. B1]